MQLSHKEIRFITARCFFALPDDGVSVGYVDAFRGATGMNMNGGGVFVYSYAAAEESCAMSDVNWVTDLLGSELTEGTIE